MKQPLHILFLPSWYPIKADDIGGSFFREQALALHNRGNTVGVLSPSMSSIRNWRNIFFHQHGIQFENDKGVLTYRQQLINFTPRINKIIRSRKVAIGLKLFDEYVLHNSIPDIIHVHSMIDAGFIAYRINQKYGVPYVVTEHSTAFARGLVDKKVIEKLQPVVKLATDKIAVSSEFGKLLENIFKNTLWQYIPNIVNDDFFEQNLDLFKEDKDFTFINICLLDHKKRVDILIKSFAKAFKGSLNIKLKLGGDGPIRSSLEKLVKSEGVSEQVTFLGALERKQVRNEIANADAFVLSSEYETFGVVIIEALALGKPVVATRCGGPESIIVPEVGYLVDKNSVKSLAQGMIELYNKRDKYSAEYIRKYCRNSFSEETVYNKLIGIYQSVLNESVYESKQNIKYK